MATIASEDLAHVNTVSAWAGFRPGFWQKEIDVRDFIQQNYEPYEGDGSFLAPATLRTKNSVGRSERSLCGRAQERRTRRFPSAQLHYIACPGLHRSAE